MKEKSAKNKTIDMSVEEGRKYFERCIQFESEKTFLTDGFAAAASGNRNVLLPGQIIDKTICGDTFSVLPAVPQNFADLAIVDPPYNLYKNYGGNVFSEKNADEYCEYTKKWLLLLLPVLKATASVYICCDWKSSVQIAGVLTDFEREEKLFVQNRITWEREKGRGALKNWKNSMEDIWFCTKDKNNYAFNLDAVKIRRKVVAPYKKDGVPKDWEETSRGNFRNTCPGNFWDDISVPYWSMPENTAHPTQKPEKLLAKLILASSNPGDVIFDPFLGSGSTSVTAKKLGRHFCGIEQNPQYCVWAEKRLESAENDKSIQGFSGGVFYERNTKVPEK